MNFLSTIVLILLTLAGYSTGAVIVEGREKKPPGLFDLGIAVLLLAMALATRTVIGRQIAIPFWFILAGLVSGLVTNVWRRKGRTEKAPIPAPADTGGLRRAWRWWKTFALELGNYQGRLLFAFFYFILVTPFGLGVRLFSDPLKVAPHPRITCWSERDSRRHEFKAAREQF